MPMLGLDQRELLEGGGYNWRMMGAGGIHIENCWQLDLSSLAQLYLSAFFVVTTGCR